MKVNIVYNVEIKYVPEMFGQPFRPEPGSFGWMIMEHFPKQDQDSFITVTQFSSGERAELCAVTKDQFESWRNRKLYGIRVRFS